MLVLECYLEPKSCKSALKHHTGKQKRKKIFTLAYANPECPLGAFRTLSIIPPLHCAN